MTINITNINPAPGAPLADGVPLSFDVTFSPAESIQNILVQLQFFGVGELVWDGGGFLVPYAGSSTREEIPDGYRFTIRRSGGWPGAPVISISPASAGSTGTGRAEVPLWSCARAQIDSALAGPAWRTVGMFRPDLTHFAAGISLAFYAHVLVEYAIVGLTSHWQIVRRSDLVAIASGTLSGSPGEAGPTAITLADDTLYLFQIDAIGVGGSFASADARVFAREYF